MSDLIPRLLEAIAAKELKARAAEQIHIAWNWQRMSGKQTMGAFLADNDPSSVLHRCAEDRKTVLAFKGMDEAKRGGLIGDIDEGKWIGLHIAVSGIARSYGITEEAK